MKQWEEGMARGRYSWEGNCLGNWFCWIFFLGTSLRERRPEGQDCGRDFHLYTTMMFFYLFLSLIFFIFILYFIPANYSALYVSIFHCSLGFNIISIKSAIMTYITLFPNRRAASSTKILFPFCRFRLED